MVSQRTPRDAPRATPLLPSLLLSLIGVSPLVLAGCAEDTSPAGGSASGSSEALDSVLDPALDGRVAYLLVPCARGGYYGVATGDVLPILEETLLHGHRDPLKRAKAELGSMGAEGLQVLRRIVRANWNLTDGRNHIRNALEAATMGDAPGVRELLLEGLEHPNEDLRLISLRGLETHGVPEDYDAMFQALAIATAPFYPRVLASMYKVAPAQTQSLILGWLERGEYAQFWDQLVPMLATVQDPELVERCRPLWPDLDPHYQPSVAVPCSRAGDPDATRALDGWLRDSGNGILRRYTALALEQAGLFERLTPMLSGDPNAENRLIAAGIVTATPERTRTVRAAVAAGMGDADSSVRFACLRGLIAIDDAGAIDAALELLSGTGPDALRDGIRLLTPGMRERPALAERTFEVLLERNEAESHRPVEERMKLLQVMAEVPLESAARYLYEQSLLVPGTFIQGRRAERWFLLLLGNIGAAAHPLLEGLLDQPRGQVQRIDVLEALAMRGGEAGRSSMLRFLEREDARPFEVLYAADRLVRMGPAREVAPVLKRATLRSDHRQVRPALECLMWTAYPGPD